MQELQPTTPETLPAAIALQQLVNSNIYLLGHGTGMRERAESATAQGLHTKHTDLESTALGLETLADSPEAFEKNEALLKQWPHHGAKHIVVLGVERLTGENIP